MTSTDIEIATAVLTFVSSVGASMFVAGSRWGRIEQDVKSINDRLAKIEGMFTLRLKDPTE